MSNQIIASICILSSPKNIIYIFNSSLHSSHLQICKGILGCVKIHAIKDE